MPEARLGMAGHISFTKTEKEILLPYIAILSAGKDSKNYLLIFSDFKILNKLQVK